MYPATSLVHGPKTLNYQVATMGTMWYIDTAISSSMHVYQGARKPSHGTLKSAPQAMLKGHSKTPGAEGKDLEMKEFFFGCSILTYKLRWD